MLSSGRATEENMKKKCGNLVKTLCSVYLIPNFWSMRTLFILVIYSLTIAASLFLAYFLRFDFDFRKIAPFNPFHYLLPALSIKLLMLLMFGQFRGLLSFFHMPDLVNLFWAMTISSVVLFIYSDIFVDAKNVFPRGVILSDYMISMILFSGNRLALKVFRERTISDMGKSSSGKRVVIIGAGEIGTNLASELLAHKKYGITPVLFLDEDPEKIGKYLMGLKVLDMESNFLALKNTYSLDRAVIAINNLSASKIGKIMSAMKKIGVETSIVPSYYDLATGKARVAQIREVDIEDILGRDPVKLDSENIDLMIQGKVVMVTGAGGSIGSELCSQISARSPSLLVMVDHCEVQLFSAEQNILSKDFGISIKPVVGSVADAERMDSVVKRYKPEIIFHAAAHKHVPMMESQPGEALKNNFIGTWTLSEIASENGVEKFVLISTDKAINPTNVMGASKRLAEMAIQSMQNRPENKTVFAAVRFGNVLGSSGSVIPTFKKQIALGGPVTVTHPEVTRFFMTIPEAVGLVLQCGAQSLGGEIFVLNMGESVKVIELARQLIRLSGLEPDVDIEIKIVGLRPGEKLYEEIQHKNESLVETSHPRIYGFISNPMQYKFMTGVIKEVRTSSDKYSVNELKELIFKYVPEYKAQFYD